VNKNPTTIGRRVFIGSDTALVAPVRVGDGAYIGAGSTITENIPADALAIARGRQVNKPGWAAARRREMAAAKRTSNRKPKRKASAKARHRSRARSARVSRGKVAAAAKRRNKV
jgi:serine acetyltransferase